MENSGGGGDLGSATDMSSAVDLSAEVSVSGSRSEFEGTFSLIYKGSYRKEIVSVMFRSTASLTYFGRLQSKQLKLLPRVLVWKEHVFFSFVYILHINPPTETYA